ncbi:uncharacterized protein LOC107495171 isoform X1 [Arachis duranensis]|uniref:Uncharacterized protein LOC107495171 isoform X1 n=1 Tax=Arachis duranensis TaxID=130453 RepID=A0A6P4DPF1_ARADU|nr:uncharacterized protein LOC107495171 isoform X1 [Arachis duranensis]XP_025659466.1 uncharacterized protein LOC112755532 isoform X1 [Arachis hypogaea]XP_025659467.1 uncharacterized protein LOC112755532 isoform X1 [Arachis hypogaea]XP_052119272.1 uncharacterized protein LOC107495171 isoform X1 [Arachis duranensis]
MASAEARAAFSVKRQFTTQDLRMPPDSADHHPSSISKGLESDWSPSESNSSQVLHDRNSDKLPDMKWWLHVKTNVGGEANYRCQHQNSWESELDALCSRFVDADVKSGGDQSVKSFDALSCVESANSSSEQPWNVSHKCMTKSNDTKLPKIEAARKNDLHLTPKMMGQEDFWIFDDHFVDCSADSFVIEQCKRTSSDLESQWMGAEKTRPWWCNAGKDELGSLISQKSLEETENCDLPQPQIKHLSDRPSPKSHRVDFHKSLPSSLDQKAMMDSSIANDYTSGMLNSGCSFQDSERALSLHISSSSQGKDSDSCDNDDRTISKDNHKAELLKALCHSQTRAREAEMAAQQAYIEKEHIVSLFFRQASQLFAYKQWLHMLQLENLCLQLRNKNQPLLNLLPDVKKSYRRGAKRKIRRCGVRNCAFAFALGLSLVGAGFFLGWTLGWMFPLI